MVDSAPAKTFGLTQPSDLLAKLDFDIARLRSARTSNDARYAAFDCAVDSWHLTDWILAAVGDDRHRELSGEARTSPQAAAKFAEKQVSRLPVITICKDIANGVKHFSLRPKHSLDNVSTNSSVSIRLKKDENGIEVVSVNPFAVLSVDGRRYNALEFFDDARKQWHEFLSEERLYRSGSP